MMKDTPPYIPSIVLGEKCRLNIRGFTELLPTGKTYFRTDIPKDGVCGLTEFIEINSKVKRKDLDRIISRRNLERCISKRDFKCENISFHEEGNDLPNLLIAVAFYNEEPEELRRILVSLADSVKEMEKIVNCTVLLTSDGHTPMNPRTRIYLKALFCNNNEEEEAFDTLSESLDEYCREKKLAEEDERNGISVDTRKLPPPPLTYVLQRVKKGKRLNIRIRGAKDGNDNRFLKAVLVLKSVNKRKHNSIEWAFNFAENFLPVPVETKEKDSGNGNGKDKENKGKDKGKEEKNKGKDKGKEEAYGEIAKVKLGTKSIFKPRKYAAGEMKAADYVFLTDCGTSFEPGCILRLVAYMKDNPKCVGCTGRQRVMSAELQDSEGEGFLAKFFRMVQTADYEGSYAIYTGAFSLVGCLPVLPGPCAMFRFSAFSKKRIFKAPDPLNDIISGKSRPKILDLGDADIENQLEPLLNTQNFNTRYSSTSTNSSNSDSIESYEIENELTVYEATKTDSSTETALEYFRNYVNIDIKNTDIVIENGKIAEDRIPSTSIVTHGEKGDYSTWVSGANFLFQAETVLEYFVKQRRRWINGAFFSYIWYVLIRPDLIFKSSHNIFRKIFIWLLFFLQLLTYILAIVSPAVFTSGLYLGLVSLFNGEGKDIILVVTILYSLYTYFFVWVHRYKDFVKLLFYLMAVLNSAAMIFTIAGYIRQAASWGFMPTEVDRAIIQWGVIAIMASPFVMTLISLDFKSFFLLCKTCIPYWLFVPTLVGSFTLYSMARIYDVSWGNRAVASGSNFHSVSQKQVEDMQKDFYSTSFVILIFITILNIVLTAIVIYFGVNSWFIVGTLALVFSTTFIQIIFSTIYFIGKHITGLTFWQKFSCCLCCGRRTDFLDV